MDRQALVTKMIDMLREAVETEGDGENIKVAADSSLVGGDAILSSMGLVSFIMDVEGELESEHDIQVTLVNESALSRRHSPFRTVDSLADYVLELVGEQQQSGEVAEAAPHA